jgi:lipopolysaccharide transport system permease protein
VLLELRRSLGLAAPAAGSAPVERDKWVIDATRMGIRERLHEFWRYRRVLAYFSMRFVKGMYAGTSLGVFWLFARPLLPIVISAFIFGKLLQIGSGGVPYFLFFLTGQVTWMLFERGLLFVTRSFDSSRSLIKKVYFPRLIAPFSSVLPALVHFAIYMGLLLGAVTYYYFQDGVWYLQFGPRLLLGFVAVLLAVLFAIAVGLWTSVWQAKFSDTRMTLRYVTRFWFYATPVIYPMSQIPPEHHWLVYVNPMAPIVETFKWATIGVGAFYPGPLIASCCIIAAVFAGGLWYFGRAEAASVDNL